jgi:hypothetical protein
MCELEQIALIEEAQLQGTALGQRTGLAWITALKSSQIRAWIIRSSRQRFDRNKKRKCGEGNLRSGLLSESPIR